MKYEVRVRLAASQGNREVNVEVEASDKADAIVKTALKLDDEKKDRWSLIHVVPVTS